MDEVKKTCDLEVKRGRRTARCGQAVPNNEPTAITFDSTRYVIDLCEEHQEALLAANRPFLDVASAAKKRTGTSMRKVLRTKEGAFTTADVREWLKEQGRPVSHTGRIHEEIIDEFLASRSK